MLNDLKEIIAIKSVLDDESEDAPFGLQNKAALDWFLAKASSYGLKTGNVDGYCGWAEYGEGDECVAALCHLDVVPAQNDWSSDPFCLVNEGGKLLGRGVADDKGAAVMCLHALKTLKESGFKGKKRMRVIVGLNEENGSGCMKYYKQHGEIPALSFVPDSNFPVINSEKGILHLEAQLELDKFFAKNIAYISGGETINVIPADASVSIFKDSDLGKRILSVCGSIDSQCFAKMELVGGMLAQNLNLDHFKATEEENVITFSASGIAGHALNPKNGDNAIWKIIALLGLIGEGDSKICDFMSQYICTHEGLSRLGIDKSDAQSGETTMSMGKIWVDDNNLYFTLDLRLPVSLKPDEAKKAISAVLPPRSKLETLRFSPNLFIDKDSPLIKTLLSVYEDITGREGYCIKSGGGTYARELPNAVAFGPVFEELDANLHKANEFLPLADFEIAAKVYLEAFKRLSQL